MRNGDVCLYKNSLVATVSANHNRNKKLRFCFCEKATRQKIELFYAGGVGQDRTFSTKHIDLLSAVLWG